MDFDLSPPRMLLGWVLPADPVPCVNCGSQETAMMLDDWMYVTGQEEGAAGAAP
jgi:hypothetical protein